MNATSTATVPPSAIERAVALAGGQSAVARALSNQEETLTPQAVGHWVRNNRIPAERVLDLERLALAGASERGVKPETRYTLRPDLYPLEAAA